MPCAFGPAGGCVLPGVGVGLVIVGLEGLFNVGFVVVARGYWWGSSSTAMWSMGLWMYLSNRLNPSNLLSP